MTPKPQLPQPGGFALEVDLPALLAQYPEPRSAVLPLLHRIQERDGYLSPQAIAWVAQVLGLEPIHVWELVTFYPMFREQPAGKLHIKVCRTLSCALRGSHELGQALAKALDCPMGQTRSDGAYTLEWVECLASCGTAPVVQLGETLLENCTPQRVLHALKLHSPSNSDHGQN
jgi:NADH-quinone oxidoreductase subunit E